MAAITTAAAGNWSSTSTWTGGVVPGSGDTATCTYNVTVDVDTTVGSSPSTGGTPAITIDCASRDVTLTLAAGKTLTCLGDLKMGTTYFAKGSLVLSAGGTLVFKPPSGQQYKLDCGVEENMITINGTSGSRCAVKTDKSSGGLAGYIYTDSGRTRNMGLQTASYCDFIDLGTSSAYGVQTQVDNGVTNNINVSITYCTFTRCSYKLTVGNSSTPDGNFTFTNNTFSSSVSVTSGATNPTSFNFNSEPTSGTRLMQYCSFDGLAYFAYYRKLKALDTYFGAGILISGGSGWPDATYFARNYLVIPDGVNGIGPMYGPFSDCFIVHLQNGNPHFLNLSSTVTAMTIDGCVFEAPLDTSATGDIISPATIATGTPTLVVRRCITLPNAVGTTPGKLLSCLQTGSVAITCEHNTHANEAGEHGLIGLDETASSYAGEIASCRANLVWSTNGSSTTNYAIRSAGAGTPAVDAVMVAGYNGFRNPTTGTITQTAGTTPLNVSVAGYKGIKVSGTASSQVTTGDVTADPTFVDSARNVAKWGQTLHGTDGTHVTAAAYLAANVASSTGLMAELLGYVRAGLAPRNAAFRAASYAGDTLATDAAGNAWPGGAPGIGAMGVAPASGSSAVKILLTSRRAI